MENNIKQSRLNFSCGAGAASVNLATGGLTFERPDISMGANSFAVGLSHVYNSYGFPAGINTFMGSKWKLNIQQYLKGELDFSNNADECTYIDGAGYAHKMMRYDQQTKTGSTSSFCADKYYDLEGAGLTFENSKEIFKSNVNDRLTKILYDATENRMYFDITGKLEKITSGPNEEITKIINHDGAGRVINIYDNRKPLRKITFDYENGLLSEMNCIGEQGQKLTVSYKYDSKSNITGISEFAGGTKRNSVIYTYDNSNRLRYAMRCGDNSALKIEYDNNGRIGKVSTGTVADLPQYQVWPVACASDNIVCGQIICGERLPAVINDSDFTDKEYTTFNYNANFTTVTNKKGVAIDYFFNEDGFTTAVLERKNGDGNNLRTLNKFPGKQILQDNAAPNAERINMQYAHTWPADTDISYADINNFQINLISTNLFNDLKDYRANKYPDCVNYNCTFWLKLLDPINGAKAILEIDSYKGNKQTTDSSEVVFDNTAVNSWQLVTIPIKITYETINWIKLTFSERNGNKHFMIADMRLAYGSSTAFNIWKNSFLFSPQYARLDMATYIKYTVQSTEYVETVGENFYMSPADVESTFFNMLKERSVLDSAEPYTLVYCGGTKRIANVTCTKLTIGGSDFELKTDLSLINGFGQATYSASSVSPDGNDTVRCHTFYYKSAVLGGRTVQNCICRMTQTVKNGTQLTMLACFDQHGRLLCEQDEYKVTTDYFYDVYGNIERKEISHANTAEKLVYTAQTSADETREVDYASKSEITTTLDAPLSVVKQIKYKGVNESDLNSLITYCNYNSFNDRLNSVTNIMSAGNYLGYDGYGRFNEISPYAFNSADPAKYGYKIDTDALGNQISFKLNNTLIAKNIIDRANSKTISELYRNNAPVPTDTTETKFDMYGQPFEIKENGNTISINRQSNLSESGIVCQPVSIVDPSENKTYSYTYDEFNRLTQYSNGGTNAVAVRKAGADKVQYDCVLPSTSEIEYDMTKALNPRIHSVDLHYDGRTLPANIMFLYDYDALGRHNLTDTSNFKWEKEYEPGTCYVNKVKYTRKTSGMGKIMEYTLDWRGNTTICKHKSFTSSATTTDKTYYYTYDRMNRLTAETLPDDSQNNYYYKLDGNIDYIYNSVAGVSYHTYNNGRLTQKGADSFTYDNYGNMTSNKGATLQWTRGNLLQSHAKNGTTSTYLYNYQGVRYKKVVGGTTKDYFLDGGKIIAEDWSTGGKVKYLYNAEGVAGLAFFASDYDFGDQYFFVKDAQGSVISVVDGSGMEYAAYEYDAFGNCTITQNTGNIGTLNPFRWKSYYYDTESGYYLIHNSYYDPTIRQFLDAAAPEMLLYNRTQIGGLDRYGICAAFGVSNPLQVPPNPHNCFSSLSLVVGDSISSGGGGFWRWWNSQAWYTKAGIGAIIIAGAAIISVATMGTAVPVLVGVAVGAVVGAGFEMARQVIATGGIYDWGAIGMNALGGATAASVAALAPGSLGLFGQFVFGGLGAVAGGMIDGGVNSRDTASFAFIVGGIANVAANSISKFAQGSVAKDAFGRVLFPSIMKPTVKSIMRAMEYTVFEEIMSSTFEDWMDKFLEVIF